MLSFQPSSLSCSSGPKRNLSSLAQSDYKIVQTASSNRVTSERLDSRVSSFKFQVSRSKVSTRNYFCFLKERCCIQSRSCLEIRTGDRLNCQLRQAFNKCKSTFSVSKMQLQWWVATIFLRFNSYFSNQYCKVKRGAHPFLCMETAF